jgi:predicted N-acetyltransferase YhbS
VRPAADIAADIRPLTEADVEPAWRVAHASFNALGRDGGEQADGDDAVAGGYPRVRHLLATDPGGAWVASVDGQVAGIALASVRGPLWFLSLLTVKPGLQAAGIGRRLLEAALTYGAGVPSGWILASSDPKALRRYALAGFELHPAYAATGVPDRSALPAGLGVRDGDLGRDSDLINTVATAVRGAPHGPDLDMAADMRLYIADGPGGAGYALCRDDGKLHRLGAGTPETARQLLWAVIGDADGPVTVEWVTADQQWAIDIVVAARLPLSAGPSSCPRAMSAPLCPYLPSGAYG